MKTKDYTISVVVRAPAWMTAQEARREVKTLINEQRGYMGVGGPGGEEVTVRAPRVATIAIGRVRTPRSLEDSNALDYHLSGAAEFHDPK